MPLQTCEEGEGNQARKGLRRKIPLSDSSPSNGGKALGPLLAAATELQLSRVLCIERAPALPRAVPQVSMWDSRFLAPGPVPRRSRCCRAAGSQQGWLQAASCRRNLAPARSNPGPAAGEREGRGADTAGIRQGHRGDAGGMLEG